MQFYNTMAKTVWGYTDEMSMVFCNDKTIEPSEEEVIMSTPRSCRTPLLLNKLAEKLRSGDVVLFGKLIKMMQMHKKDADLQKLASQMQSKFEALSQKKPIGMIHIMYSFTCNVFSTTLRVIVG